MKLCYGASGLPLDSATGSAFVRALSHPIVGNGGVFSGVDRATPASLACANEAYASSPRIRRAVDVSASLALAGKTLASA